MAIPYFLLLVTPFLSLVAFLATGRTTLAAAYIACLMIGLAFAFCDRTLHLRTRNVTGVELCWILYVTVLLFGIAAGGQTQDYDTLGALRIWAGLLAPSAMMLALPGMIGSPRSLHSCISALDALGLLISFSVYLPLLGFKVGAAPADVTIGDSRIFGVFGDAVAFAVPLFICRALIARRWLTFGFHVTALLLMASVGGTLTLAVAILANIVLPWKHSTQRQRGAPRVASFTFAILLAFGAITLFGQFLVQRLTGPALFDVTLVNRLTSFQIAYDIIVKHPFVGVGLRGFSDAAGELISGSIYGGMAIANQIANAQNQILQTLCDAGLLGLASLALFALAAIAVLTRAANSTSSDARAFRAYQIWFVGLVIGNQTAVWLISFSIIVLLVFTVLGVVLANERLRVAVEH